MHTAGMIIEYNPLHGGHLYLMEEIRARLGPETAFVGVMSGNFVQRGDFALLGKHARARAAVESGVDLVLELPLPWAVSSAERFADGGVQVLEATGVVTEQVFGSECGDSGALLDVAECLLSPAFAAGLCRFLGEGQSYAACRQAVVRSLLGPERADLLAQPNNILGIEYCKALLRQKSLIQPLTVARKGTPYHGRALEEGLPSATLVRDLLRTGAREQALALLPEPMARVYREEEAAGRAPVLRENCQRAILARLRSMEEADFALLDQGREGLYHRLFTASREAVSLETVLEGAKTKRYAYTRLQRMVLWAYLGLEPAKFPRRVPYLRVLGANARGRALLARMRETASLPVLTKPADVRRLGAEAMQVFQWEARASDLYALAYPDLTAGRGGSEWRAGPVIV